MIYHTPIIFPTAVEYMEYHTSRLLFKFKGTLQTVNATTAAAALQLPVETVQGDPQFDEYR